jgi:hypothetical protein
VPLEGPLAKLVQDSDFSIFGPLATEDIIDDLRGSAYFVSARNCIACNAQSCGNARANQPYIAQRDVCLPERAVILETVSVSNSLLTGNSAGNFAGFGRIRLF